jgi:hypothetical protein
MSTGQKKPLISSKDIDQGAISALGRSFGMSNSKSREAKISVSFRAVNSPLPVYHGLGFVPTGFSVVTANAGTGVAPGKIYSDIPLQATAKCVVLYCDTANTTAEVLIR